ncbi:MAG: hypothetical protein SAK42_19080, partial [Oscillatoria sp. PMC 1076.18]|nr:hypothetical protein [Oscillatoria sp. PMC 1076.18]
NKPTLSRDYRKHTQASKIDSNEISEDIFPSRLPQKPNHVTHTYFRNLNHKQTKKYQSRRD